MDYRRRAIDDDLDELFPLLAAVAIEGAKGVGKTATAKRRSSSVLTLNEPRDREIVTADPDRLMRVARPLFIDEWQLVPDVWERVRRAVDDDATGGQFLLAGSAGLAPGVRIHSGAGRIVRMRMRPMSFEERSVETPTVSLTTLLAGARPAIAGRTDVGLDHYVDEILRSGLPGIRDLPEPVRRVQLDSYLDRIVDRELPENGVSVRRPAALRAWLNAYAAATATDAAHSVILDAATPGENEKPTRQTVVQYRESLERLFVLDPLEAWLPTLAPLKRLTKAPKHHLLDPALAARTVGIGRGGLLEGRGEPSGLSTGTWLGALFESLVVLSVRAGLGLSGARAYHLRTANTEHEIDLIVEGEDRRVVAIEVKLSATVSDRDVRHLTWLQGQIGDRVADRVVVTTGRDAYRRPDGIAVVPLALLGR
ncbi:MAG: ATP-binding protein [Actinobacteria bacterium]|nr:ATP-binding protein [Actinomycetota bacterium]